MRGGCHQVEVQWEGSRWVTNQDNSNWVLGICNLSGGGPLKTALETKGKCALNSAASWCSASGLGCTRDKGENDEMHQVRDGAPLGATNMKNDDKKKIMYTYVRTRSLFPAKVIAGCQVVGKFSDCPSLRGAHGNASNGV